MDKSKSGGIKRLVLEKETVKELTDPEMRRVAGGAATANCTVGPTGCENTGIICEFSERTCCFPSL